MTHFKRLESGRLWIRDESRGVKCKLEQRIRVPMCLTLQLFALTLFVTAMSPVQKEGQK